METKSRVVFVRDCEERGMESSCLMGAEFQCGMMKKVTDMDGGTDCTAM
jgi:hypothetical protein